MISDNFLAEFKNTTEKKWSLTSLNPKIYGFQIQPGTRWNPGLSDEKITEYENLAGTRFPHDFKKFLKVMNGTNRETINIYGSSGEPQRQSVGVYSYPKDVEIIKQRLDDINQNRDRVVHDLSESGFDLSPEAKLIPIYSHRYVVCAPDLDSSVVVSVVAGDAIVYGSTLEEYLKKEFL